MDYSIDIARNIKNFLDGDNWNYSFDESTGIFKAGINLNCKLGSTDIRIRVGEDFYTVYSMIKLTADEGCRAAVAEFITRANYGLRNGNFEMDYRDGEMRYKSYNNCDGRLPSEAIIADSIMVPALMIDRYGDGLLAVMFGMKTPEAAIEEIESQNS